MEPITGVMGATVLYIGNRLNSSKSNPTTHNILKNGLIAEGYKVISASHLKNKILRLIHMVFVFVKNYRKTDYVLIDVYSTTNFWYAVIIGNLSRRFSKKYIPILHGGNLQERFLKSPSESKLLLQNAYYIISPSLFLKEEMENAGYKNVEYIPNPLFIQNYTFRVREHVKPMLLWVRAFDKIYNPMLALKAVELLIKIYPGVQLCMVGPDKDGSLSLCKTYAEDRALPVTFTGKLKKKEWAALAHNYDIFLNTSKIDNTPVSVVEAMAMGLPVVSTKVGGIPYLIKEGETGILVAPNNAEAIALAIESLVENRTSAKEISRQARAKVEEWDWNTVKTTWQQILT